MSNILNKVKRFINRNKPSNKLVLHKRVKGRDWYIGERCYDHVVIKNTRDVVDLRSINQTSKKQKQDWIAWANSNFSGGWSLTTLDKDGEILDDEK